MRNRPADDRADQPADKGLWQSDHAFKVAVDKIRQVDHEIHRPHANAQRDRKPRRPLTALLPTDNATDPARYGDHAKQCAKEH